MADTVTVTKIYDGDRRCSYRFTNESDGTGESNIRKIDLDDLVRSDGTVPKSLSLDEINYDVNGFNYVVIKWDRSPNDFPIEVMKGTNSKSYRDLGYLHDPGREVSGTGYVLISTDGGADGSSYNIVVVFLKKGNA